MSNGKSAWKPDSSFDPIVVGGEKIVEEASLVDATHQVEEEQDLFFEPVEVADVQEELRMVAEESDAENINHIYLRLAQVEWLRSAYQQVAKNSGANTAGVDGQTMRDFERNLDQNLENLAMLLEEESYRPQAVRRVLIPKSGGGQRPIGILSIRDRIVQEALLLLIQPIFEGGFSPNSYAYRKNYSTRDAITSLRQEARSKTWVVDIDVEDFFGSIDHDILLGLLARKIADGQVLRLIQLFLKAGVMHNNQLTASPIGISQGGIISPLLANIYLDELDTFVQEGYVVNSDKKRKAIAYIRYADDFIILCHSKVQAQNMLEAVSGFLASLKLSVSDQKTSIHKLSKRSRFLGFDIKKPSGLRRNLLVYIPQESLENILQKIVRLTNPQNSQANLGVHEGEKIARLNLMISSWAHMHKHADNAEKVFNVVDKAMKTGLEQWLSAKQGTSTKKIRRAYTQGNT